MQPLLNFDAFKNTTKILLHIYEWWYIYSRLNIIWAAYLDRQLCILLWLKENVDAFWLHFLSLGF